MSKFKNIQAVERRVEKLTCSIDWEEVSIDRDTILLNFNSTQQSIKRQGFNPNLLGI